MKKILDCENYRRFGVEIELNTANGLIVKLDPDKKERPNGSLRIASLINDIVSEDVEYQQWGYNSNNEQWIVKPDSSCGIEVCTPVLKGWKGLKSLIKVVESLKQNKISSDKRCSLHVHVDIKDLNETQLSSVIAWYIKCEHIIMDMVPIHRKINRYCQMIGASDLFTVDSSLSPHNLIERVSSVKYFSINTYHFYKGGGFSLNNSRRKTIEFRIGENSMCLDGYAVKNWIRFLLHFVDCTKDLPIPQKYVPEKKWTGLCWLDSRDLFKILNFEEEDISDGLKQMKSWVLERMLEFGYNNDSFGFWSNDVRNYARSDFLDYYEENYSTNKSTRNKMLYDNQYSK